MSEGDRLNESAAQQRGINLNDALDQRTANVLASSIPWDGYKRAGLLSDGEHKALSKLDTLFKRQAQAQAQSGGKKSKSAATGETTGDVIRQALSKPSNGAQLDEFVALFLALLSKINKEETLQYLLCLVYELVAPQPSPIVEDPSDPKQVQEAHAAKVAAETFRLEMVDRFLGVGGGAAVATAGDSADGSTGAGAGPFEPLTRLLARSNNDWFSNAKAASAVTELLLGQLRQAGTSNAEQDAVATSNSAVGFLSDWLTEQLRKGDERENAVAVHVLMRFATGQPFRAVFARDGLPLLAGLLKSRMKSVQLVYEITNVMWLLSYDATARAFMAKMARVIPVLVEVVREVKKEKAIRMAIGTLANLADDSVEDTDATQQMVDCGLGHPLGHMAEKSWGDEEMEADIERLMERLDENKTEMSGFDVYKREVLSGRLEWSLVHKSEKFWRENAHRLEEDKCKLLLMVKELLSHDDPAVREVACYDVGEFARHHPRGKVIVNDLNIKMPLMERMLNDQDDRVKTQALMAVQKLMVHHWQFLA